MQEFFCRATNFFARALCHGYASVGEVKPRGVSLLGDEADTIRASAVAALPHVWRQRGLWLTVPPPLRGAESTAAQDLL